MSNYKLTFLGTGTSTGVPVLRCHCATCSSTDSRDKRFRASAVITLPSGENLLIDCGPDFRSQLLREQSPELAALLITHSHYDHVGGIDDLRPYCASHLKFPVYCQADVARDLRERNPWSFAEHLYPGVPTFDIHTVKAFEPFTVAGQRILPLPVMHAKLPILGYRVGPVAYITDCSYMPDETIEALRGVDTMVLNALRPAPHMSHLSLSEALELIKEIKPARAFLTHMSHDMPPHAQVELPENVTLSFDTLSITIPSER